MKRSELKKIIKEIYQESSKNINPIMDNDDDSELQIKKAKFYNGLFYLDDEEKKELIIQAKYECKTYKNQCEVLKYPKEYILAFQKGVTPKSWEHWVNYNEGNDRFTNICNLFNEDYNDSRSGMVKLAKKLINKK